MNIFEDKIAPSLKHGTPFRQIDPQLLVDSAEQISEKIRVEESSKHQLRKFYNAVKRIERQTLKLEANNGSSARLPSPITFLASASCQRPA